MCQETNKQTKKTSQTLEYTRYLSKQRAMSHKTYVTSNKNVDNETTKMCNMKMEGKSAGVYGFMVSILFSSLFFSRAKRPHAVHALPPMQCLCHDDHWLLLDS